MYYSAADQGGQIKVPSGKKQASSYLYHCISLPYGIIHFSSKEMFPIALKKSDRNPEISIKQLHKV